MTNNPFNTALLAKATEIDITGNRLQVSFSHNTLTDLIYQLRTEPFSGITVVDVYARLVGDPGKDHPVLMTNMPSVQIVGFWETARAMSIDLAEQSTVDGSIGAILAS
jgi:hypothetical protein